MANIYFAKNGYIEEQRFGKPKSLLPKYMLATSSCLYAGLSCELLLAVRNDSTCMQHLGEQELLKAGASKDRNTSETSSEHPILYIQKWCS